MVPANQRVGDAPANSLPKRQLLQPGSIFRGLRPSPKASEFVSSGTHDGEKSFGVVYVNDVARNALAAPPSTLFSEGAIIVREKLATAGSTKPELLAVMIKRARGFNSAANDWEFLLVNGGVTEVKHREKTGSCQECHTSQKDKDFVFRVYVP